MSVTALALALAVALSAIAVVLNHCYARLALVELALNEGLPPGHQPSLYGAAHGENATADVGVVEATKRLEPGVHLFLSRSCHACQRLIDDLDASAPKIDAPVFVRYVDRPRPVAHSAAKKLHATVQEGQASTIEAVAADPLPYTIAIGHHRMVSRAVTPSVTQFITAVRDAGYKADLAVEVDQ